MKKLIIIGAGGHGKVCAEIAQDMNKWDEIYFLDDRFPEIKKCLNFEILGTSREIKLFEKSDFFVAIGNNEVRANTIKKLLGKKLNVVILIHPTSYVSKYSNIQVGTSIHQFAVINSDTNVGKGCIINTSVNVEHDNKIGDYTHLSPNVCLGGNVSIGNYCWIGMGATIKNNVSVVKNTLVGAHSLVIKDIIKPGKYVGIPIKNNED